MRDSIIRCPLCNKIYFDIGQEVCPHCKNKPPKDGMDIFNEIFGAITLFQTWE
jgi:hypothetical protein